MRAPATKTDRWLARAAGSTPSGYLKHAPAVPLKDQAYEIIRHHIITCRFAPGEKLNEAQVADSLGLSRMPVRHALARLRLEGLITIRPRKGIEVRPIDPAELLKIIEARTVNECHAVRLAAARFSPEDIAAMDGMLRDTEAALEQHDTEALMLLDTAFHALIARASGNEVFAEILGNLHDRAVRFWFISLDEPNHQRSVLQEHLEIRNALAARNADEASAAMERHIAAFRRNVTHLIGQ
ncbi:GntR family transcriptional regulator [Sabulicella rubraurantiaca]|uniref:GntR family transcriptional regulator n=1 Tax=Sabulicella rubraurantiaca TaxID=2811429 RepID=UPI001A97581E|nr:GntR family transcriptional regulator [Sabulicella rubraurantiaca]